ncbi:recombinase family protein [Pseudomonas putida]|uniref:Recombinase family protein n=1 Tax=Pseudomonas putida TaxID=303 RepID=A0A8I1ELI0_PSEPU|nr:recombinase family protein [Pseudomonas putida]MBI6887218.1 recombinase family protein [Pseudomonas putida]
MAIVGYARVSTGEQDVAAQKHSLGKYSVEEWFEDQGVSGAVPALERPGCSAMLAYVRKGDTVVVSAVDRLGRDTIDVLSTVQALQAKGVSVISEREGFDLSKPVGKAMLTMLSAVAELERSNIKARQMAGIERAKADGKALGRKATVDPAVVSTWRKENAASIAQTAEHFGISTATVKRCCKL